MPQGNGGYHVKEQGPHEHGNRVLLTFSDTCERHNMFVHLQLPREVPGPLLPRHGGVQM